MPGTEMMDSAARPPRSRFLLSPRAGLIIAGVLLLLSVPIVVRAVRISGVPDPGDPFDVAAFTATTVAPEANAFEQFRRAAALFRPLATEPSAETLEKALDEGWDSAPDSVRQWVTDNAPAREFFEAGADCPDALYIPPAELRWSTPLPLMNDLRALQRAQMLEAARLRAEGDHEGAWKRLHAGYRASRHCGRRGSVIERLVGCALHGMAVAHLARWAADPKTTAVELERAREAVRGDYRLTAPLSTNYKCDYLMTFNAPDELLMSHPAAASSSSSSPQSWAVKTALWVFGEPELTARIGKHVYGNLLSQCDLPLAQQVSATGIHLQLFDTSAPGTPAAANAVAPPATIDAMARRSLIARLISPADTQIQRAVAREQGRQAVLELLLDVERVRRNTGRFPENTAALERELGHPLPADPCSASAPLHYRCDDPEGRHAVIWSVGPDGVDHGGLIDVQSSPSGGADLIGYPGGERRANTASESP